MVDYFTVELALKCATTGVGSMKDIGLVVERTCKDIKGKPY